METMGNVILKWQGKEYKVTQESGMMRMLSVMQDFLPVSTAFKNMADSSTVNLARYSEAYAAALKVAGCNVSSIQIYKEMIKNSQSISEVVGGVVMIYTALHKSNDGEEEEEKKNEKNRIE